MKKNKAQEEMVGFAMIIIVVSVILLVFLTFSLRSPQKDTVESYEVDSFIQSMLIYTTDCEDNIEPLSIQDLIFSCNKNEKCIDERPSCDVLSSVLADLTKESWPVGDERPIKGYELDITSDTKNILNIKEGTTTVNSKGSSQEFRRAIVLFKVYYN